MGIILWIIFGGLVGWIASIIMGTNAQQGILLNVIVGVIGAVIGGWLMSIVGGGGVGGFNPEGSITLDIKKGGSYVLISVADTGYGIPKAAQSRIFTKMFRADNVRVKDPNGTGLGLYIIKETVEKTGGKIWFKSKENQGSTFYVSIPLEGMKKRKGAKRPQ